MRFTRFGLILSMLAAWVAKLTGAPAEARWPLIKCDRCGYCNRLGKCTLYANGWFRAHYKYRCQEYNGSLGRWQCKRDTLCGMGAPRPCSPTIIR